MAIREILLSRIKETDHNTFDASLSWFAREFGTRPDAVLKGFPLLVRHFKGANASASGLRSLPPVCVTQRYADADSLFKTTGLRDRIYYRAAVAANLQWLPALVDPSVGSDEWRAMRDARRRLGDLFDVRI